MNETEWLTSEDPRAMFAYLSLGCSRVRHVSASDRKLRLFACACCRHVWSMLADEWSRRPVEIAERYADGLATWEELRAVHFEGREREEGGYWLPAGPVQRLLWVTTAMATSPALYPMYVTCWSNCFGPVPLATQAALLREVIGNPWRPVVLPVEITFVKRQGWKERGGTSTEPIARCPWLTPTVLALARAAYDERAGDGRLDPDRLAVLADALEDAGCDSEELLRHLRGQECCFVCEKGTDWRPLQGPGHVRGCWALDLLLGKGQS